MYSIYSYTGHPWIYTFLNTPEVCNLSLHTLIRFIDCIFFCVLHYVYLRYIVNIKISSNVINVKEFIVNSVYLSEYTHKTFTLLPIANDLAPGTNRG